MQFLIKLIDERINKMATSQMETKHAVPDLMLSQTRVIRAPRERVYEAWTNPELLSQWLGSATTHCPEPVMDLRVGGRYRFEFAPKTPAPSADGPRMAAEGEFMTIVPNELLKFTWSPTFNPDEHSVVTVMLKDVPGGTELTLVHENFLTEASREGHKNGWAGSFEKLVTLLEA
jgi:uncharacterized protein YndB with AHSA1/START domain